MSKPTHSPSLSNPSSPTLAVTPAATHPNAETPSTTFSPPTCPGSSSVPTVTVRPSKAALPIVKLYCAKPLITVPIMGTLPTTTKSRTAPAVTKLPTAAPPSTVSPTIA